MMEASYHEDASRQVVIQNGKFKEEKFSTGKMEHLRRFHGMDDAKEIWEAIRTRKARKGIGLHTSTEPESGEVDITSSKIMKWQILRHGGKCYCHLIRANQRDSVFVNFGAMLHNISRDDLI
ncbi:hypothetical protein Tco_0847933 [Tanacetum coccineum]